MLRSGRETFDYPAVFLAPITQPIVQPAAAALPEFHHRRGKSPSTPMRRQRHLAAGIFLLQHFHAVLEYCPPRDNRALLRAPGRELARGREWKYASLSSRGTFVTLPSTITWRSSAIHGNTIVATEFSWSSRPFRLS